MAFPDPIQCDERGLLYWIYLRLTQAFGNGSSGSGGGVTTTPVEYNVSATSQPAISSTSVLISNNTTVARKIDITLTGDNPVTIGRATTASAGMSYLLLAKGSVLTVDEPTRDYFTAIAPSGDSTLAVVERIANGTPDEPA